MKDLIKTTNWKIVYLILLFIFPILILWSNLKRAIYHCINANDFSIYQQAIYEIANGTSWNPYITIRNVNIFNDHADPIIYLGAIFVKILGYSSQVLLTFEWLWFIVLIALYYFLNLKRFKSPINREFLLGLTFLIFSRSLLEGLEFPIHPTTWSMIPCFLLVYFLYRNNFKGVVLSAIAICLFREIFPFMVVALSGYYLVNKKILKGLIIFSIGGIFLFTYFYLRPKLMGPTLAYGNQIVSDLINGHIPYIIERLKIAQYRPKIFAVYLIPIVLLIQFEIKGKGLKGLLNHPLTATLLFIFPVLFLHLLIGGFRQHHSVPMIAPILGLILFSTVPHKIFLMRFRGRYIFFLVVPIMATSSSRYTRMVNLIFADKAGNCVISDEKLAATKELYKHLKKVPLKANTITSSGLSQAVIRPGQNLFQISNTTRIQSRYDYLAVEKNYNGDITPLKEHHANRIMKECRPFASKILIDNDFYLMMKGPFTDECIGLKRMWPFIDDKIRI